MPKKNPMREFAPVRTKRDGPRIRLDAVVPAPVRQALGVRRATGSSSRRARPGPPTAPPDEAPPPALAPLEDDVRRRLGK